MKSVGVLLQRFLFYILMIINLLSSQHALFLYVLPSHLKQILHLILQQIVTSSLLEREQGCVILPLLNSHNNKQITSSI